jgi:hypothetical protein
MAKLHQKYSIAFSWWGRGCVGLLLLPPSWSAVHYRSTINQLWLCCVVHNFHMQMTDRHSTGANQGMTMARHIIF